MVGGFVEGDGELLTRSEIEGGIADQVRRTGPSGSFGWSRQDFDVINSSSSTNTQGTAMNTSRIGFIIIIYSYTGYSPFNYQKGIPPPILSSAMRCKCPSASSLFSAQIELSRSNRSQSRSPALLDAWVVAICSNNFSRSTSSWWSRLSAAGSSTDGEALPPGTTVARPAR